MIKPSKRQEKEAPQLFKTHLKLAAKRNRNKRLSTAGIAASICSLILWLLGVSLFIHVLGVLISFAIGFLFPVGKAHSWALDLIAKDTGLSYQTALEQQDKVQESAYNLLEPLNQHAHKMIRRLSEPSLRRWWLPLLVLAFGLTLLPVSPFSSSPRALGLPSNLNPLGSAPDQEQGQTSTPAETQANEPNTQTPCAKEQSWPSAPAVSSSSGCHRQRFLRGTLHRRCPCHTTRMPIPDCP